MANESIEPVNGQGNNGSNANVKPELQAIAEAIEHTALAIEEGLAALAEAVKQVGVGPKG